MNYYSKHTKLGYLTIEEENGFLTKVYWEKRTDGTPTPFLHKAFKEIEEYLSGLRTKFDLPFNLKGTDFQKKVWEELLKIPYGETRSYKQIAIAIGNPNASRAVGLANNKNPLCILIPCHRVIGTNGKLIGYAGGLDIKNKLLELEK